MAATHPQNGVPAGESEAGGTAKRQLILAGEKLFAKWGIEGASLREIAIAAGQGNNNAVRYHFGSKEGLVQAIFRYRAAGFEPIRQQMLADAERDGLTGDARTLLEIICLPHLRLLDDEGRYSYAAFLIQYLLHERPRGMLHAADSLGTLLPAIRRTQDLLHERLFYLSPETIDRRVLNLTITFLSTLINQENRDPRPSGDAFLMIIEDTLEQMVASICVPQVNPARFDNAREHLRKASALPLSAK